MEVQIPMLIQAMTDAIFNVLETMFFLPLEAEEIVPLKKLQFQPDDTVLAASLEFSGFRQGYSTFFSALEPATNITADFLGVPVTAVTMKQIKGTVGEIANMLTGDTFSRFDSRSVFNLSVPRSVSISDIPGHTGGCVEAEITMGIHASIGPMAYQMVIMV